MPSKLNAISTGTPSLKFTAAGDGALEIQNDGNTAISISNTGVATFAQPPLTAVPAFEVTRITSTHILTQNGAAKVQFNNKVIDTNSWFDTTTNYRYTPEIPGYYYFFGQVYITSSGATAAQPLIYKNGSQNIAGSFFLFSSSAFVVTPPVQQVIYMNGSTDYVEFYAYTNGANPVVTVSPSTLFSGFLVRAA